MQLRASLPNETDRLTALSVAAFATDAAVGSPFAGGPPAYDDPAWHRQRQQEGHLFTVLDGDTIVAGMLLFLDEHAPDVLYVGRIFVDPARFRQGVGAFAMRAAETLYPQARVLRLDTPVWNARTNAFYRKLGYHEVRRDANFVYYQKEWLR